MSNLLRIFAVVFCILIGAYSLKGETFNYTLKKAEIDLLYKKYQLTGDKKIKQQVLRKIDLLLQTLKNGEKVELLEPKKEKRVFGFKLREENGKLIVREVKLDSIAYLSGMKEGDIIEKINGEKCAGLKNFANMFFSFVKKNETIIFSIMRKDKKIKLILKGGF
jgi:predicted metalloprotease with PDZ domain